MTHRQNQPRGGFTMVETVICVVIVAGMLVCSLEMLGTAARLRRTQSEQSRALALARQLLSEIAQYSYMDSSLPTLVLAPELLETRPTFDDVDDYNGLSESPPKTSSDTTIAGYTGWSRAVTVEYVDPANPGGAASLTDQNLKRITVAVTSPTGRLTRVVGLRSKYGLYEKDYSSAATYPTYVTITLQIGSDSSTKVTAGVNPVNQVP